MWRTNVFHLPVRGNGDGGLYTTVADVHRFWAALTAGQIVPDPVVTDMLRPRSAVEEEGVRGGLGFWRARTGDAVMLVGGDAGVSFQSFPLAGRQHHPHGHRHGERRGGPHREGHQRAPDIADAR